MLSTHAMHNHMYYRYFPERELLYGSTPGGWMGFTVGLGFAVLASCRYKISLTARIEAALAQWAVILAHAVVLGLETVGARPHARFLAMQIESARYENNQYVAGVAVSEEKEFLAMQIESARHENNQYAAGVAVSEDEKEFLAMQIESARHENTPYAAGVAVSEEGKEFLAMQIESARHENNPYAAGVAVSEEEKEKKEAEEKKELQSRVKALEEEAAERDAESSAFQAVMLELNEALESRVKVLQEEAAVSRAKLHCSEEESKAVLDDQKIAFEAHMAVWKAKVHQLEAEKIDLEARINELTALGFRVSEELGTVKCWSPSLPRIPASPSSLNDSGTEGATLWWRPKDSEELGLTQLAPPLSPAPRKLLQTLLDASTMYRPKGSEESELAPPLSPAPQILQNLLDATTAWRKATTARDSADLELAQWAPPLPPAPQILRNRSGTTIVTGEVPTALQKLDTEGAALWWRPKDSAVSEELAAGEVPTALQNLDPEGAPLWWRPNGSEESADAP